VHSVISCKQLSKSYGLKKVLQRIDLEVPTGTIFALLGTNGAGKTTLIRTILGLIPKSGGDVRVLGEEPYRIGPQLRQRIGYVSEEQGLYSWMTVQEIIRFCKALYRKWDQTFVAKYLEQFNLDPHTRIGNLSKGQTVKLALILALAPQPELLILDEPMNGLDPLAQYEFLQVIMRDINLEGRTIFFSTHNLADVEQAAKQVAIVHGGIIQVCGPIDEVCNRINKIEIKTADMARVKNMGLVLQRGQEYSGFVFAANTYSEVATALAEPSANVQSASLEEAFLFYCSGGKSR
jgi:ABC-2 type transport system ATP-binding protein